MIEQFRKNEPLLKYTNFHIGGPAKYFFEAKSSEDIVRAVEWALDQGEQFFTLGGGSNVLISDEGFSGLVIKVANRNIIFNKESISAEAGAISAFLARKTAEQGLSGFEWAISLPGTLGGAIRGNAGCFDGETRDVVHAVSALRIANNSLQTVTLRNEQCHFQYRESIFKHWKGQVVILGAELKLQREERAKCEARLARYIHLRKDKQPLDFGSAGCIFKNYHLDSTQDTLNFQIPDDFMIKKTIPAGWLIEQAGLKGSSCGGAIISAKHGNFIVNAHNAKAKDVRELISQAKEAVFNRFGIALQEEIRIV